MTAPARPEKPPLKGQRIEIAVRFAECDAYRVVWHGHHALYLEQAREALTGRFGFTAARALDLGYRVPIIRMEIRYHRPIAADSKIRVTASLRPPQTARLVLDYEIRDESEKLLVEAQTEQVVVNREGELLLSLPEALRKLVEEILKYQESL